MELVIMYLVAIAAVGIVGFMLVKKMDIKISLFLIGIVLMYISIADGQGHLIHRLRFQWCHLA